MKYFGSGVIICTAFIHLLAPSWEALTSPCLGEDSGELFSLRRHFPALVQLPLTSPWRPKTFDTVWASYPWTPAIAMFSVFAIFLTELIAHRTGASYLKRRGLRAHDPHAAGANRASHTTHGLHTQPLQGEDGGLIGGNKGHGAHEESAVAHTHEEEELIDENAVAQIIGVAILEFGVM